MLGQEQLEVIRECKDHSLRGIITFPEVVRKLGEVGVERYHADFTRDECTHYMRDGESHIESVGWARVPIAEGFVAGGVEAAIRSIMRGEIVYEEFCRRIMAAGCAGYFVHITGRCAIYLGRDGGLHIEPFPSV